MSTTGKVVIGILILGAVGFAVYFATRGSGRVTSGATTGPAATAAGLTQSIGAGLTGLVSTIVGAVEAEEERQREEPPAAPTEET